MANTIAKKTTDLIDRFGALPLAALIGLVAGLITLVIHNSLFEAAILATGLNEMIPAAAPPLGMTARIAIAIATALFTMGVCSVLFSMLVEEDEEDDFAPEMYYDDIDDKPKLGIAERIRSFLPFSYGSVDVDDADADVHDLRELPRTRRADSHPDAPVRAPLLAGRDLTEEEREAVAVTENDKPKGKPAVSDRLKNLLPVELLRGENSDDSEPLVVKQPEQPQRIAEDVPDTVEPVVQSQETLEPLVEESAEVPVNDHLAVQAAGLAAFLGRDADQQEEFTNEAFSDADHDALGTLDGEADLATKANGKTELSELTIDELIARLERGLDQLADTNEEREVADVVPLTSPESTQAPPAAEDIVLQAVVDDEEILDADAMAPGPEEAIPQDAIDEPAEEITEPVMAEKLAGPLAEPVMANQVEEVDAALKAALETLRQMTEEQRSAS
ncbi:hypothetical protein [Alterisphingorhabdus coralli]|uniref:Uncharacterized protein n=1 Tax=Alterisphingorhabdus coralli TaxID=3071408 RepID=A0AA97I0E2_9SPHN|nr:hypothetical protein [Parasphingorhabdus sp. SCSIO 66989]WOE74837.1 hypothetical protein RB602_13490 [Parasphingorhabdus sp. SCSIO 66989]